jgi:transposase
LNTVGSSNNRKGRPNYPGDFKERLAKQACELGDSVSKLARQHGINVNMLFEWRRDCVLIC